MVYDGVNEASEAVGAVMLHTFTISSVTVLKSMTPTVLTLPSPKDTVSGWLTTDGVSQSL